MRFASPRPEPDGYTLMIGNSGTQAFSQPLRKTPPYNSVTDFTPVGLALGIAAHPDRAQGFAGEQSAGIRRLCEIKPEQDAVRFGRRRLGHASALRAAQYGDGRHRHPRALSRRGSGATGSDRRPDRLYVLDHSDRRALAKQNEVKGIAVMSPHRVKIIPEVPTTGEQGLPGVEASVWNAFFLPNTPPPIVQKLNKAMSDTLDDPAVSKRLEDLGLEIVAPEQPHTSLSRQIRGRGGRALDQSGAGRGDYPGMKPRKINSRSS